MTPFCDVDNPTICLSAGLLGGSLGRRECGDGVGGPSEKGAEQPHAASRSCHRGGAGGGPEGGAEPGVDPSGILGKSNQPGFPPGSRTWGAGPAWGRPVLRVGARARSAPNCECGVGLPLSGGEDRWDPFSISTTSPPTGACGEIDSG